MANKHKRRCLASFLSGKCKLKLQGAWCPFSTWEWQLTLCFHSQRIETGVTQGWCPPEWLIFEKQTKCQYQMLVKLWNSWNFYTLLVGMQNVPSEAVWQFLTKLNISSPYAPAVPILGVYSCNVKAYVHTQAWVWRLEGSSFLHPEGENNQCAFSLMNGSMW